MQQHAFPARDIRGGDATTLAEFFVDAVPLTAKSEELGKPVSEDRVHVRIVVPGDSRSEIVRQATEQDKRRFALQYEAFERGNKEALHVGVMLSNWPQATPALIRMLNAVNIFTVEQLAEVNDANLAHIGLGGRELRQKAQAYLAHARDSADVQRYAAENERMSREIEDLKRQVALLAVKAEAAEGEDAPRARKGK